MTRNLTIVPAGAGAGKTYRIENALAQWVEEKLVAPGRILAVTFTEAAAAELKTRIRAELMKRGRIEDALEIDRAYVGTIHALGQRLLTEHAFAASRPPDSRLLSEAERDLLIRREIARCEELHPVMGDLARFGYRWNPVNGNSAEDSFRADLLRTIDILRGLGEPGLSPKILEPALQVMDDRYGPRAADGDSLTSELMVAVQSLLDGFPNSLAPEGQNATARRDFARDYTNLQRAAYTDALSDDWTLWQKLRTLRLRKRGAPTPEGYDEVAQAVMSAADVLPRHPGPLEDAKAHLTALVKGAQQSLHAYQEAKQKGGLIDYADMIVETEALLRSQPEILNAVLTEIDCVVVDEFQDTNPVQFALLWRLANGAKNALVVGDAKQSIMGFQGADARLSTALQDAHSDNVDPLDRNWRSDPRIMQLVNAMGPALFPKAYDQLAPTRKETGTTALEAIVLPRSWPNGKNRTADCVADRIANLIDDGEQIWDQSEEVLRKAQPADIAVLCYTSSNCVAMAEVLQSRGIAVRISGDGWHSAPIIRAARAALAFVADPDDQYAALTWMTLGPPNITLQHALRSAVEGTLNTNLSLSLLQALNQHVHDKPLADLVAEVLSVAELRDWATLLADPAQALADHGRFEAEAREFDMLAHALRTAAGFHGTGPQVFLGWIASQTDKTWDRHPNPNGWSGTGVEICTWHAAKGREWPITVVAGLDFKFPERPGTLRAEFNRFDDLDNVLDQAGLAWLPDFAAPESQKSFSDALIDEDEQDAARELYVALTRARDRLILVLPAEPSQDKERPERMIDLLRERTGLAAANGTITVCEHAFSARVTNEDPDREFPEPIVVEGPKWARFGSSVEAPQEYETTPWRQSPSSLEADPSGNCPPLTHVSLGTKIATGSDHFDSATNQGTAWHLAFRTLCQRSDLRDRLPSSTGLDLATIDTIQMQAHAVRSWLAHEGYDQLHFELPVQSVASDGSETNAIIDCLAEGAGGFLILDHKSGPCPDPDTRFATYLPQLEAYQRLVRAQWPGKPVRALAINWMNEGRISVAAI